MEIEKQVWINERRQESRWHGELTDADIPGIRLRAGEKRSARALLANEISPRDREYRRRKRFYNSRRERGREGSRKPHLSLRVFMNQPREAFVVLYLIKERNFTVDVR